VTSASCGGTFNPRHGQAQRRLCRRHHDLLRHGGNKSTIAWNGTTQLVITLGAASGGTTSGVAAAAPSYTGSASIKDWPATA